MQYNVHYDIGAIFVCLFAIYCIISKKSLVRRQNCVLLALTIITLLCAAFDLLAVYGLRGDSPMPYTLCYLFNLLYFLFHNLAGLVALLYLGHLTGENFKYSPYYYFGVSFPYILIVLGLITNHWHNFLFRITPNRIYLRETGFFLLYLVGAIYLLAIVVKLFKYRISMDPSKRWMILFYLLSSIAAITVEYFIPSALVEIFSQSIAILGVIYTVDNLREISDPDTMAYNREALFEDLDTLFCAHQEFQLFVIKLSSLTEMIPKLGLEPTAKMLLDISAFFRTFPDTELYHCGEGRFVMTFFDESKRDDFIETIRLRFREPWCYDQIETHFCLELCYAQSPTEIQNPLDLYTILQAPMQPFTDNNTTSRIYDYNRYLRENQVVAAIERALKDRSFEIYYQPIMDVQNHAIRSAEALIRLNDENLGYIAPDEFIPLAERRGYIIPIGDYVMEEVCRFISENDLSDYGIQFIDINLSPIQCMDQKLATRFLDIARTYHIRPDQLNFELTEYAISQNKTLLPMLIERFSKRDVNISLDDYGNGNSNIASLFKLPFTLVKIDKNVLWEAEKSDQTLQILKSTMQLIKSFDMKLLMEGIETEHQLNWLLDNGCDYCQGYYFSRALPGGDFLRYVSRFNNIAE